MLVLYVYMEGVRGGLNFINVAILASGFHTLSWDQSIRKQKIAAEYILFSPRSRLTVICVIHGRKDIFHLQGQTNVDKAIREKFLLLENAGKVSMEGQKKKDMLSDLSILV